MGHGNHWRCIFPDLTNGLAEVVGWFSQGAVLGQRDYTKLPLPGADTGATVALIAWPRSGLRANFVVVRDKRSGRAYLHTAFPAASSGCRHKIRIDAVREVSCGLEARISGVLGDAAVTFFDPLYSLNRDRYSPGAVVDVELAGIAYSMKVVPGGTKLRTAVGDVSMDGAAALMSVGNDASDRRDRTFGDEKAFGVAYLEQTDTYPLPDDYQFCAPVKHVKELEIAGIPVWKCRAILMRVQDGRQEVEVDIYATRESLRDGAAPGPGDEASGTLWLQGTLPPL
ncbi:MAG: hypothetical protein KIT09_32340 [Bryobacteraceae bacterium]|nr:hypothetical protein [Bryobacteraceae bacterium]